MKKDSVYVRHIIDAINKIEQYVQIGHEDFIVQSHWQDAIIRHLDVAL